MGGYHTPLLPFMPHGDPDARLCPALHTARLRLWVEVFRRFFGWVWLAVAILAISGIGMLHMRFSGFETAPKYVQVMIGVGIAMFALFMRIQALLLPELKTAVQAEDWPTGAAVLGRIRRMVGINLLLGLAVVAVASSRLMI